MIFVTMLFFIYGLFSTIIMYRAGRELIRRRESQEYNRARDKHATLITVYDRCHALALRLQDEEHLKESFGARTCAAVVMEMAHVESQKMSEALRKRA